MHIRIWFATADGGGIRTRETDLAILLGLEDVEAAVEEAGLLFDLTQTERVSTGCARGAAGQQAEGCAHLLERKLGLAPCVGVVVQAGHEQAPNGGRVHDEGAERGGLPSVVGMVQLRRRRGTGVVGRRRR